MTDFDAIMQANLKMTVFLRRTIANERKRQKAMVLLFVAGCAPFCALSIGNGQERIHRIKLNQKAFHYAQELINHDHLVLDDRSEWSRHRPSAEEENEFIRLHGFSEYAKWHLGIDDVHAENTKARYKFPYGDFKNVHRCALIAAKSRAGQYKHYNIENAALELDEMISMSRGRVKNLDRDRAGGLCVTLFVARTYQ